MVVIVTGVSGTGKTTIGKLIAGKLNVPFYDADDFHPKENIEKMSNGMALNDGDRAPWLVILADKLLQSSKSKGCVLGCSALKESYRKVLNGDLDVQWIHLKGDKDLIWERMKARKNHYMKAEMLDSQFATWEEPDYGLKLEIVNTPEVMLEEAMTYLHNQSLR